MVKFQIVKGKTRSRLFNEVSFAEMPVGEEHEYAFSISELCSKVENEDNHFRHVYSV